MKGKGEQTGPCAPIGQCSLESGSGTASASCVSPADLGSESLLSDLLQMFLKWVHCVETFRTVKMAISTGQLLSDAFV